MAVVAHTENDVEFVRDAFYRKNGSIPQQILCGFFPIENGLSRSTVWATDYWALFITH